MSRVSLGIGAAVLFVFFLVVNAPARLLNYLLPEDQFIVQGLEGTLWQGAASRAMVATAPGYVHLGRLNWTLRPLSLLLFAPSLDIRSEWGAQTLSGRVTLRGGRSFGLRDFEAMGSADLLRQFAPVALTGTITAQLERFVLVDGLPTTASGRLVWQNAGWLSPQGPLPLGAYALEFEQAVGESLVGEVITIAGPVEAEGSIRLSEVDYALDLTVAGETPLEPQLQQALALVAQAVNNSYRIQLQGPLPGRDALPGDESTN